MPTLNQITAKDVAALTTLERNHVFRVLQKALGSDVDLDATLTAFVAEQNQEARAILDDWDAVSPLPVEKTGGTKGTVYKAYEHRYWVYIDMARLTGVTALDYDHWYELYKGGGAKLISLAVPLFETFGSEFSQ